MQPAPQHPAFYTPHLCTFTPLPPCTLHLCPRRSSHFFISGNNPIAKLPEYLETMLGKMAKEIPGILKAEANDSQDNGEVGFLILTLDLARLASDFS